MTTNIIIEDKLVTEAVKLGKHNSKKAAVVEALKEYITRKKQAKIIDLFHTIDYVHDHDYKKQRKIK